MAYCSSPPTEQMLNVASAGYIFKTPKQHVLSHTNALTTLQILTVKIYLVKFDDNWQRMQIPSSLGRMDYGPDGCFENPMDAGRW